MDSVTAAPAPRRAALREKLETALAAAHHAASAAALKGDPLADQLDAITASIDLLGQLYEASEDTQLEIAETLRTQADAVADEAIEKVHASGVDILNQLTPKLVALVETNVRHRLFTWRLRWIIGTVAGGMATLAIAGGIVYDIGYSSGRAASEAASKTISVAMASSPAAETAWAMLMANNDPVKALAACKKSLQANADGRRYCALPVWLDSPSAPASP